MTLNSLHVLLTYQCNYACDHCFVWGSPWQTGVFTLAQLENVYRQSLELGTIREFYFEGGEPFLYYPVLLAAVRRAHELGFATGIVTNGYWATDLDDARAWLRPLAEAGLDRLDISCDLFHGNEAQAGAAHVGQAAADELGLRSGQIAVTPPTGYRQPDEATRGQPITGGDVMFRGRAAAVLTRDLPRQPWRTFDTCPYEDLVHPGRVHLDPAGFLHLCQGLVMGNLFARRLVDIVADYDPESHPVVGPLLAGGPARLVETYGLAHEPGYVDACHLCFETRLALRPRFSALLAPDPMYGEP